MASDRTESQDSHGEFGWQIDEQKIKAYTVRQTNDGIHCTITLKQVVTVCIVVLAHELDILR
jgi:hypothetical protein